MLLNFTNHPCASWGDAQLAASRPYGEPADLPFPSVPPQASEEEISRLADQYMERILALKPAAVLCQGEMTLTFALVSRLLQAGVPVLAACSERKTKEQVTSDGSTRKISLFEFCRYRAYIA